MSMPGSRCERVQAEKFGRDALNALKFCMEYAEFNTFLTEFQYFSYKNLALPKIPISTFSTHSLHKVKTSTVEQNSYIIKALQKKNNFSAFSTFPR